MLSGITQTRSDYVYAKPSQETLPKSRRGLA
jgi:hypothetical protein